MQVFWFNSEASRFGLGARFLDKPLKSQLPLVMASLLIDGSCQNNSSQNPHGNRRIGGERAPQVSLVVTPKMLPYSWGFVLVTFWVTVTKCLAY